MEALDGAQLTEQLREVMPIIPAQRKSRFSPNSNAQKPAADVCMCNAAQGSGRLTDDMTLNTPKVQCLPCSSPRF